MPESNDKLAIVAGAGPGLGRGVCRRFAREGYTVAALARRAESVRAAVDDAAELPGAVRHVPCDITDAEAASKAFEEIRERLGRPAVGVYNAGAFQMGGVLELDAGTFERCWRANCHGGFVFAQQLLPAMLEAGEGTLIFTGATASLRGSANFTALATGKFGLRALTQSLAREFGPRGIHVAHVIIDGQIYGPSMPEQYPDRDQATFLDPDSIAETYWQLHKQSPTAWTLELDLRPMTERF